MSPSRDGDVITGRCWLHSEEEGIVFVERLTGLVSLIIRTCPSVIYTDPELASVGLSAADPSRAFAMSGSGGADLRNGRAIASAMPREWSDNLTREGDRILGVHILAHGA